MTKTTSALLALFLLIVCGCTSEQPQASPAALIASAWNNYRAGVFDSATREFETALARSPQDSDENLQALYGLAVSWHLRSPGEDRAKAELLYQQLVQRAPKHDLAAWSLLALARLKHVVPVDQKSDHSAVRKAYQECIDRFPGHVAAEEAFIYQQSTHVITLDVAETELARAALEKFVAEKPKSRFLGSAYQLLSKCYETLRQPRKQLAARIKSAESEEFDPENPEPERSKTYWDIATIAEFDAGDFDAARKYYKLLIEEYPTDIHKYGAKSALRRMDEMESKLRAEARP